MFSCACAAPITTNRSYMCAMGQTLLLWAGARLRGDLIRASKKKGLEGVTFQWEKSASMEKRLWQEGKAGFHFDLKSQHSSLLDLLPLLLGPLKMYYSSKGFCSKLNSFNSLSAGKFRVHWIFYFRGKGQTNLNLSILRLQPTKPPSYLLWLSPDLLSRCCICKTVP